MKLPPEKEKMSSSSAGKPPVAAAQNPSNWRFVWEAQSHTSILRLLLFNTSINPSTQCRDLKIDLIPEQSLLTVSFLETYAQVETSMRVPLPRVLIDPDSPIHFRAFDDHIEAKLVLLLPVDHTLVSDFDSILNFKENKDELRPLSMDSDIKKLSCMKEVHFYCRNCSTKLTKDLRCFEEMPSVNWRDAADNWFGNCCCSFGGVSEELVKKYVKSYTCAPGLCLLNTTSVLLCKNDLLGCEFPDLSGNHEKELLGCNGARNFIYTEDDIAPIKENGALENVVDASLSCSFPALQIEENKVGRDGKNQRGKCSTGCCPVSKAPVNRVNDELLKNQKIFLDGFLGNGFMVRSSGLSKDIQWTDFLCPECSYLVGAYPCFDDNVPLDGGVRLFKCSISTSSANSGPDDSFGKYTLERMFASQLLELAEDELSFRTVVRDIQTKSPELQIILLNPNSWSSTGHLTEPAAVNLVMHPTVKMLFSTFSNGTESDPRIVEDWITENQVDEVYMFSSQIQELIRAFEHGNELFPSSYQSLQGLFLSSLKR